MRVNFCYYCIYVELMLVRVMERQYSCEAINEPLYE